MYDAGAHPDDAQDAVLDVEAVASTGSWLPAVSEDARPLQRDTEGSGFVMAGLPQHCYSTCGWQHVTW